MTGQRTGHGQFGELVGYVVDRLNCLQRRPRKGVTPARSISLLRGRGVFFLDRETRL